MLALDDGAHLFVGQRLIPSREGCPHESHIVHAETRKVFVVRDRDALGFQNLSIGLQMNALIIADDAVKVEKDCRDHPEKIFPSPHGRASKNLKEHCPRRSKQAFLVRRSDYSARRTAAADVRSSSRPGVAVLRSGQFHFSDSPENPNRRASDPYPTVGSAT